MNKLLIILFLLLFISGCDNEHNNPILSLTPVPTRTPFPTPTPLPTPTPTPTPTPLPFEGTATIVAFGDSITFGDGSNSGGYPPILEQKLRSSIGGNIILDNEGIPGLTTPEGVNEIGREIRDGDLVLIMLGTNDVNNPAGCPIPFDCQTISSLREMVNIARSQGVIPILATIPPVNPNGRLAASKPNVDALNADIRSLALEEQVVLAEVHDAMILAGGNNLSSLFADGVHPNDRGYEVIAQAWFDAFAASNILQQLKVLMLQSRSPTSKQVFR